MDTLVHRYLTYSWCFKCLSVPCWHDPHFHTLSHLQKGTSLQGASWQLVEIGSNWGLNWSDALNDSLRFPEPLWALQSVSVSPAIWIALFLGSLSQMWPKCGSPLMLQFRQISTIHCIHCIHCATHGTRGTHLRHAPSMCEASLPLLHRDLGRIYGALDWFTGIQENHRTH